VSLPFKDELFQAQWLRTAGHAHAGGADLGECLAAADAIREADLESWRDVWMDQADRLAAEGESCLKAGRLVSAHGAFLRASNYYRTAYVFLLRPEPDARLKETYRRHREAFEISMLARPGWGERIAVPFERGRLKGYFFAAGVAARRTLIVTGGYDSTAEEAYFYSGPAALARGVNVVCDDGPGRAGRSLKTGSYSVPIGKPFTRPLLKRFACAQRSIRSGLYQWA
jgi:hypothetical protein